MGFALNYSSVANITGVLITGLALTYFASRRNKTTVTWIGVAFFPCFLVTFALYIYMNTALDVSSFWPYLFAHVVQAVSWTSQIFLAYRLFAVTSKREYWIVNGFYVVASLVALVWMYFHFEKLPTYNFSDDSIGFSIAGPPVFSVIFALGSVLMVQIALRKAVYFSKLEEPSEWERARNAGAWSRVKYSARRLVSPVGQNAQVCRALAVLFTLGFGATVSYALASFELMRAETFSQFFVSVSIVMSFFFIVTLINNAGQPFTFMTKVVGITLTFLLLTFVHFSGITMEKAKTDYQTTLAQDARWVRDLVKNKLLVPESIPDNVSYILTRDPNSGPYSNESLFLFMREGKFNREYLSEENDRIMTYVTASGKQDDILSSWFLYLIALQQGNFSPEYHGQFVTSPGRFIFYSFVEGDQFYEVGFSHNAYRAELHAMGMQLLYALFGSVAIVLVVFPLFFKQNLVQPLERLLVGVRKVDEGDLAATVVNTVPDEFGALSASFNKMTQTLRKNRDELEQYSRHLEAMVQERTAELRAANQSITTMVNSLGQGFLLVDPSGVCLPTYSKACEQLLEAVPAGKSWADVLKLPPDQRDGFEKWLSVVFEELLDFEDAAALAIGGTVFKHSDDSRHITLEYKPVRSEEGRMAQFVVIATDKTAERDAKLEAQREQEHAKLILMLMKNKVGFVEFIRDAKKLMASMKGYSESTDQAEFDYPLVLRQLHTVKGSAAMFSVIPLKKKAHDYESEFIEMRKPGTAPLSVLREKLGICATDLEATLSAMIEEHKDFLVDLLEKDDEMLEIPRSALTAFYRDLASIPGAGSLKERFASTFISQPIQKYFSHFDSIVDVTAEGLQKKVSPIVFKNGDLRIDGDQYGTLFSSLVHAFRNAVDHGIEPPEDRKSVSKPEAGRIEVEFQRAELEGKPVLKIEIRDDGAGIDPAKIRKKLTKEGRAAEAERETDHEVIQHVFDSGLSTKEAVTEHSGRGVGMDAIKFAAEELGGKVHVNSKVGSGSTLVVYVPELSSDLSAN